jgi:uncharacterized protein YbbC (DUF1343 family)
MKIYLFLLLMLLDAGSQGCGQPASTGNGPVCGADQTGVYLPLLKGKKIAIMANQTSKVGKRHLVDTLVSLRVDVVKIFSPEHGFRGNEADGQEISDGTDRKTGLPVISLYGNNKKPTPEQLSDVDIVIFDIQDVGCRFYTFISSMHYLMEACAENGKEFLVLDRPDPNGNYIDGPVLEKGFESFVGMHPVPVVHGMTIAEYARMINGEGWLKDSIRCRLSWVPCLNYTHSTPYSLSVPPSPNLPDMQAVKLYPSLAFFEGTVVSEGRGTLFPFQAFGYPGFEGGDLEYTPLSIQGVAVHPKFENTLCRWKDLRGYEPENGNWNEIDLGWLISAWQSYPDRQNFFKPYFDKLAGTDSLRKDIQAGLDEKSIKAHWEAGLEKYKKMREKYVLYK